MTTETFDARDALDAYYGDRTAQRPSRLWSVEKLVQVLAEAGFVTLFKGGGSNPTVLTDYHVSKLWLRVEAGVTNAPGTIRSYDGGGTVSLLSSWPVLDLAGLRRHLSVYSKAEVDAAIAAGLPASFGSDDIENDSGVSGATTSDALDALKALVDANTASITSLGTSKVSTTALGAVSGVATLDGGGKVPTSQLPAAILSPFQFQGTWNASTNSPALASGVGTAGHVYRVSVAGLTELDSQSNWQVGDEVYFGGGVWNRLGTTTPTTISKIGKGVGFAGGNTRAFVTSNNELFAVGDNTNSQNGFSTGNTTLPVMVPFNVTPGTISKVVCGPVSTYVLDASGRVFSFGGNGSGQLGHNDTTARQVATRIEYFVSNSITIADIFPCSDAGGTGYSVFFLSTTGALYACGANANGQLGLGDTTQRSQPVLVSAVSNVAFVAAGTSGGGNHALAITTSGALWATGYNATGQLGLGDTTQRLTFTLVTGFTNAASAVVAGSSNTATVAGGVSLVLKTDGTVWAAGYNAQGTLGLGDTTNRSAFVQTALTNVTKLAISPDVVPGAIAAALKSNGNVAVWGYNGAGGCGTGNTTNQTSPQEPSGSFQGSATDVACAGTGTTSASVYVRTASSVWACGYSTNGNLGINSTAASVTTFAQGVGITGTISDWAVVGTGLTFGVTLLYSGGRVGVCGAGVAGQLALGVASNSAVYRTIGAPRMGA